ncbi:MAG: sensor histidine kinase [Bacteroidetes bacterium]|nr:sensor histidine kinase [Bacteroidota bacterium]
MSILEHNLPNLKMEGKEGLDALFLYATEGIVVTNKTGELVKVNPAAEKMFGYGKGELIGKKVEILVPTRYAHRHEKHRDNFSGNPHARSMGAGFDLYGLRKDGTEFPVEISLSPYTSDDNAYVIGFVVDITTRKQAEERLKNYSLELEKQVEKRTLIMSEAIEELEKTRDELHKALGKEKELSELKSRFVSMASHEFRTPLATVLSSLSLVQKYGEQGDKEKQTKHMMRIKSSITHLTDILNDMLSISKLEEGAISVSKEIFDIKEFIITLVREMRPICKTGQALNYNHTGTDNNINLDKKILRHIMFNLISNAIKFSPENKPIDVSSEVTNDKIIISVKDNGIGISKEDQKHLFERFFRGENASNIQGTGLGLNIVAKYIEVLDGTVECISELDKGTEFKIVFYK